MTTMLLMTRTGFSNLGPLMMTGMTLLCMMTVMMSLHKLTITALAIMAAVTLIHMATVMLIRMTVVTLTHMAALMIMSMIYHPMHLTCTIRCSV
ncbi:hypothetical protein IWW56_005934 [Coemansia sp. RSA 2131]|nr:hypothetical protein IWW56_005934 [Coemansia sp. RSA 2131]